jgi:hypothetical protein
VALSQVILLYNRFNDNFFSLFLGRGTHHGQHILELKVSLTFDRFFNINAALGCVASVGLGAGHQLLKLRWAVMRQHVRCHADAQFLLCDSLLLEQGGTCLVESVVDFANLDRHILSRCLFTRLHNVIQKIYKNNTLDADFQRNETLLGGTVPDKMSMQGSGLFLLLAIQSTAPAYLGDRNNFPKQREPRAIKAALSGILPACIVALAAFKEEAHSSFAIKSGSFSYFLPKSVAVRSRI